MLAPPRWPFAAACMGMNTLLLTQHRRLGLAVSQPADRRYRQVSGKEVDAFGGVMALATDMAGFSFVH